MHNLDFRIGPIRYKTSLTKSRKMQNEQNDEWSVQGTMLWNNNEGAKIISSEI